MGAAHSAKDSVFIWMTNGGHSNSVNRRNVFLRNCYQLASRKRPLCDFGSCSQAFEQIDEAVACPPQLIQDVFNRCAGASRATREAASALYKKGGVSLPFRPWATMENLDFPKSRRCQPRWLVDE